jgi:hypothetical protein
MISIGTQLEPRSADDPVVRVCGIEGQRYILSPLEFGSNFALDYDEIVSRYDVTNWTVTIPEYSEQDAWRQLSSEKYHGVLQESRRNARRQKALPSPETVFAEAAAAEAD